MPTIELPEYGERFDMAADATILEGAWVAGLRLPYACTQGSCGVCKAKLLSGEVEMEHSGGISRSEIAMGYILTCCSVPKTDLAILLNE